MSNFVEFLDYVSGRIDSGSMWFGFMLCMFFDCVFSLDSFLMEKAFDLFSRRKQKNKKVSEDHRNGSEQ